MRLRKSGFLLVVGLLFFVGCLGGGNVGRYSVTGNISQYKSGEPLSGVEIAFAPGGVANSEEDGSFRMSGLSGKVTVTPQLGEWEFVPASRAVTSADANRPLEFVAYRNGEFVPGNITISFIGDYGVKAAMYNRPHFDFSRENYRSELQNPGRKVDSFTPHKFLVNLQEIAVADPGYHLPLLMPPMVQTGSGGHGSELPMHFDLAMSRDVVLDMSYLLQYESYDFQAVQFLFFTQDGTEKGWYDLPFLSEIHVDLGEDYRGVTLANEDPAKAYGTTHVFELAELIPLENSATTPVVYLVFADYVEEPFILNPDGHYLHFDAHPWDEGLGFGLAGYAIYLPGFELNFSEEMQNHLVFSWDLTDLIEIYDNGSDNREDHLVTFRLDDPFPIELFLESYAKQPEPEVEPRGVGEVGHLDLRYYDLVNQEVALRWTNPSDDQYYVTHLVRKIGSAPEDMSDGELIYSGHFPIFQDIGVEKDQHYFYRVITESLSGALSEGLIVDIVTHIPPLGDIQLWVEGEYDNRPTEEVEVTVGEWVQIYVTSDMNLPH